jgi:hypothetical protein
MWRTARALMREYRTPASNPMPQERRDQIVAQLALFRARHAMPGDRTGVLRELHTNPAKWIRRIIAA